MKILVLGSTGMLGHKVLQVLDKNHEVFATARKLPENLARHGLFRNVLVGYEATDLKAIESLIEKERFDVVINCIGIIKQLKEAYNPIPSIEINSLLPHRLNAKCKATGARFIHISTDCVFNGRRGSYKETDEPDAVDLYGKSKELGEVSEYGLTIRTSIIGHELNSKVSLVDWFLSQSDTVNGYRKAIYSGLPTVVLARQISQIIEDFPLLQGVYQIASPSINKYDLLRLIASKYQKEIEIVPTDDFVNDKSLVFDKYRKETGVNIAEWPELVDRMHTDYIANTELYK